jgi:hypothetical protein
MSFRSDSERQLAEWLTKQGVKWEYENYEFAYTSRIKGGVCEVCGAPAVQKRLYTPDFFFTDLGWFLEVKGQLSSSDRKKYRDFKKTNPEIDLRFLLLANNLLKAGDKDGGRYSDWCEKFGFRYYLRSLVPKDLTGKG